SRRAPAPPRLLHRSRTMPRLPTRRAFRRRASTFALRLLLTTFGEPRLGGGEQRPRRGDALTRDFFRRPGPMVGIRRLVAHAALVALLHEQLKDFRPAHDAFARSQPVGSRSFLRNGPGRHVAELDGET